MDVNYYRQYLNSYPVGISTTTSSTSQKQPNYCSPRQRTQSEHSDASCLSATRPKIHIMKKYENNYQKTNNTHLNKINLLSAKQTIIHNEQSSPSQKPSSQQQSFIITNTQSPIQTKGLSSRNNRYLNINTDTDLDIRQSKSLGNSPDKENINPSSNIIPPTPKPQPHLITQNSPKSQEQINNLQKLDINPTQPEKIVILSTIPQSSLNPPPTNQSNTNNRQSRSLPVPAQAESLKGRKTLVLDLDETLVHSQLAKPSKFDVHFKVSLRGKDSQFYMNLRPGVHEFLSFVAKHFEVFIWTASVSEYASVVIKYLDPKNELISHSLFRDACKQMGNGFVKDLSILNRDLKDIIIIDNLRSSFRLHLENGIQIEDFIDNQNDTRLKQMIPFLDYISNSAKVTDVRQVLQWRHRFESQANENKPLDTHTSKPLNNQDVLIKSETKAKDVPSTQIIQTTTATFENNLKPKKNENSGVISLQILEENTEESRVLFDAFTYSKFQIEESRVVEEKVHNHTQRVLSDINSNTYTYSQANPLRILTLDQPKNPHQEKQQQQQQQRINILKSPQKYPAAAATTEEEEHQRLSVKDPISENSITIPNPNNNSNNTFSLSSQNTSEPHKLDQIRIQTPRFEERLSILLQSQQPQLQSSNSQEKQEACLHQPISINPLVPPFDDSLHKFSHASIQTPTAAATTPINILTSHIIADSIRLSPSREMQQPTSPIHGQPKQTTEIHKDQNTSQQKPGFLLRHHLRQDEQSQQLSITPHASPSPTTTVLTTEPRTSHNERTSITQVYQVKQYHQPIPLSLSPLSTTNSTTGTQPPSAQSTAAQVRLLNNHQYHHRPTLSLGSQYQLQQQPPLHTTPNNCSPYSSTQIAVSPPAAVPRFLQFPNSNQQRALQQQQQLQQQQLHQQYQEQKFSFQNTRSQLEQRRFYRESLGTRRSEVPRIHATSFYTQSNNSDTNFNNVSLLQPSRTTTTSHSRSTSLTQQDIAVYSYSSADIPANKGNLTTTKPCIDHRISSPLQSKLVSPIEQLLGDLLITSPQSKQSQQFQSQQQQHQYTYKEIYTPCSSSSKNTTHNSSIGSANVSVTSNTTTALQTQQPQDDHSNKHRQRTPSTTSSPNTSERASRESSSSVRNELVNRANPVAATAATVKLSCFYDTPIYLQQQSQNGGVPQNQLMQHNSKQAYGTQNYQQPCPSPSLQSSRLAAFSSIDRVFHLI